MAEQPLHRRQGHARLHQLHRPGPPDALGSAQPAGKAAALGPLVELAADKGRVHGKTAGEQGAERRLGQGGRQFTHQGLGQGYLAAVLTLAQGQAAAGGVDGGAGIEAKDLVQLGAGAADEQEDEQDAAAGQGHVRSAGRGGPPAEGLLQLVELDRVQAGAVIRGGDEGARTGGVGVPGRAGRGLGIVRVHKPGWGWGQGKRTA